MHLDQECQQCQQWGSIRHPTPFGVTFPDIFMGSQLASTIHQWAKLPWISSSATVATWGCCTSTSFSWLHIFDENIWSSHPIAVHRNQGPRCRWRCSPFMAPSPNRRRRRPTATSAAVAVAVAAALPGLRLATVPLGQGILRDSSGVPPVPASFYLQVGLSMGDCGNQEGCQRCPLGTMKKSFVRGYTPRCFFRFSAGLAQVCRSPSTIRATGVRWGFAIQQNRQNGSHLHMGLSENVGYIPNEIAI